MALMEQISRRPGGRRSRGRRRMVLIPTTEAFYVRLVETSRSLNIGISEYVCAELAHHHGLDVPEYIQPSLAMDVAQTPIAVRKNATVRVPEAHHARYQAEADARGLSLAEYARRVMAARLGLEDLPEDHPQPREEPLLSA